MHSGLTRVALLIYMAASPRSDHGPGVAPKDRGALSDPLVS